MYRSFDVNIFNNPIDAINKAYELNGFTPGSNDFEIEKYYYKPNIYYIYGAYIYCFDSEMPIDKVKYFYMANGAFYDWQKYPPKIFETIDDTVKYALAVLEPSWIHWAFVVNKSVNNFKLAKNPETLDELAEFLIKGKNNFARYFLYKYEVGTIHYVNYNPSGLSQ